MYNKLCSNVRISSGLSWVNLQHTLLMNHLFKFKVSKALFLNSKVCLFIALWASFRLDSNIPTENIYLLETPWWRQVTRWAGIEKGKQKQRLCFSSPDTYTERNEIFHENIILCCWSNRKRWRKHTFEQVVFQALPWARLLPGISNLEQIQDTLMCALKSLHYQNKMYSKQWKKQ